MDDTFKEALTMPNKICWISIHVKNCYNRSSPFEFFKIYCITIVILSPI